MGTVLDSLALGFSVALQPDVLFYALIGCLVGTLVGMLPGIGPLAGISILLPLTFGLDATKAIIMLAGIYYGSQYGGSTTSILLRIPGEAASVMTCIDGNAMAKKGRAGAALCIAAVGSFIAGTFGVIVLTLIAPPLATFALRFGPPEYTALLILGLIFLAYMSTSSLPRTLLMAAFGILLGTIARTMAQFALLMMMSVMPMMMLSGGMSPVESQPQWVQYITWFFPSRHYIGFMQAIVYRGADAAMVWQEVVTMLGMGVGFLTGSLLMFRRSIAG